MNIVRYVGHKECSESRYRNLLKKQDAYSVVMDCVSAKPNVTVRASLNCSPVSLDCSPEVRDFRDISILAYVVDTLLSRNQADDYWSRELSCVVPVRNCALWKSVDSLLREVLTKLSGDRYTFEWMTCQALPAEQKHNKQVPVGMDSVCLFSGGIDSLLGAYKLLKTGKRVLLVGHQSEGATAAAQTDLFGKLSALFPNRAALVQFRVALSMTGESQFPIPPNPEDTHRVRSFLFLGLAATIAAMTGIQEIYMPENGLIALNPPLDRSRIGTCSTRTAHPSFLLRWKELARATEIFSGAVINPFICLSKTDMLRSSDTQIVSLLSRTVSCSRPSRYNSMHVRHCGYCVPCIYRRAAFAAIGRDVRSEYAFDVFSELPEFSETKRQDFIALNRFAVNFGTLNAVQKQRVIVSQGYFPPSVGSTIGVTATDDYTPWVDMLDRWSERFLRLVDEKATNPTKKIVGLN